MTVLSSCKTSYRDLTKMILNMREEKNKEKGSYHMHNTFERISIKNKMDQFRYRQKITIPSSIFLSRPFRCKRNKRWDTYMWCSDSIFFYLSNGNKLPIFESSFQKQKDDLNAEHTNRFLLPRQFNLCKYIRNPYIIINVALRFPNKL